MDYSEDEIREFVEQLKGYYDANKKRISIKKMADEIGIGKSTLEEYLYRDRLPEKNLEKIIVYLDKKDVNIDNFNFTNNKKFHQERTEEINQNKQFDENNPIFEELLETNESIRDPVHGDIGITLLEKLGRVPDLLNKHSER
jgi:ribosomal protein S24E